MSILDKILAAKYVEVAAAKKAVSAQQLETLQFFDRPIKSLVASLKAEASSGIIAEFKRKSPSKGNLSASLSTKDVCPAYQRAGAAALSILTDREFFGGDLFDLEQARPLVEIPILRKDFVIDEYQLVEAKAYGADVVLLIAAALSVKQCQQLSTFAKSLKLEVLLEVHSRNELLEYCNDDVALVGVNNRNLKTFEVSLELSRQLAELIPNKFIKVAESGLRDPQQVLELRGLGFQGFLIGESFMREGNPGENCASFIAGLL